jgi:hypothetical protein
MDMYWAHILQSQLKKNNEKKDNKSPENKSPDKSKDNNCGKCGQNPYFCQCSLIITPFLKDKFDFEKSIY